MMILLYIQDEISYDRFHEHAKRIYRIVDKTDALVPYAVGPMVRRELPEVINQVRIAPSGLWMMQADGSSFYEERVFWAGETLFEVFSFPFIHGNPNTALRDPFSVVITEDIARKYFGDENPLGKVIKADETLADLTVTGVILNVPRQSHLKGDFFISLVTLESIRRPGILTDWRSTCFTYILLSNPHLVQELEQQFPILIDRYEGYTLKSDDITLNLSLQPLTDIHLYSHLQNEVEVNNDITQIYILISIAVVILLIACINAMNLATARSMNRAREIGLRKVVGASRAQLIKQFLSEAVLVAFLSLPLAVALVSLALPTFNKITEKTLYFTHLDNWIMIAGCIGILIVVGFISGGYPAFVISAFRPNDALKGSFKSVRTRVLSRKMLVIGQFTISIVFLIITGMVHQQMRYINTKNLGFNAEQVIVVWAPINPIMQQYEALKDRLLQFPKVLHVTRTYDVPGRTVPNIYPVRLSGQSEDEALNIRTLTGDVGYVEAFDIELIAGRSILQDMPTDMNGAILFDEMAVAHFGWTSPEDAVGRQVEIGEFSRGQLIGFRERTVVGVVKNIHIRSLHHATEPLAFRPWSWGDHFIIRIASDQVGSTLTDIHRTWQTIFPNYPTMTYSFLDDDFDKLYRSEEKMGVLLGIFSGLAVFIASLGLLSLAAFTVKQRTKEVGVRKVLGASGINIVRLLSTDLVKLVLLATLIATPLAYIMVRIWLQRFAYRIDLEIGIFILGSSVALVIALLTVSYHTIKAASANPVEVLRHE